MRKIINLIEAQWEEVIYPKSPNVPRVDLAHT